MAFSTDEQYNAHSRTILIKIDIFLDGEEETPVSVTRDNYLTDFTLLEEATSGDTPFDNVSSNEVSFSLSSPDGLFNPNNASGPYANKLVRGVLIRPYIKASLSDDWDALGKFYVTDWTAKVNADVANVVADDILYDIFSQPAVDIPVVKNQLAGDLYSRFFSLYNITPTIDAALTRVLAFSYINTDNKKFLTELTSSLLAVCSCNHEGSLTIVNLSASQPIRAILTDSDQLVTITTQISIASDYDTALLTYYVPFEGEEEKLLDLGSVTLPSGPSNQLFSLTKSPLVSLRRISLFGEEVLYNFSSVTGTSKTVSMQIINPDATDNIVRLEVRGTPLSSTEYSLGTSGSNTLKINNKYIQSHEIAQQYNGVLQRFTLNDLPVITATIRGNPTLHIGDKIRITSARFHTDFTGILMRQNFQYNGGLSSTISLLNAALVEVIS